MHAASFSLSICLKATEFNNAPVCTRPEWGHCWPLEPVYSLSISLSLPHATIPPGLRAFNLFISSSECVPVLLYLGKVNRHTNRPPHAGVWMFREWFFLATIYRVGGEKQEQELTASFNFYYPRLISCTNFNNFPTENFRSSCEKLPCPRLFNYYTIIISAGICTINRLVSSL